MSGKIINLYPAEDDVKDFVFQYIENNKDNIQNIVVMVKTKESEEEQGIYVMHSDPPFETLCAMLKMFEYVVQKHINEETEYEEE